MKIRITGSGIFGANGELPIGFEMVVKEEPICWAGKYVVVDANPSDDAVALTNPKRARKPAETVKEVTEEPIVVEEEQKDAE